MKKQSKLISIFLSVALLFSLFSSVAMAINITAIELPESATMKIRSVLTLTPIISPNLANPEYQWTSSNMSVAEVCSAGNGASGNVTGVGVGTATITVTTQNGLTASCEITVDEAPFPTEVSIEPGYTILAGQVVHLNPLLLPEDATSLYTITASNPTILEVITTGGHSGVAIRGLKAGLTEIQITTSNGLVAKSSVEIIGSFYGDNNTKTAASAGLLAYSDIADSAEAVTRVECASLMAAFTGMSLSYNSIEDLPFTDCSSLTEIQKAIIYIICENEIMTGTAKDLFSPTRVMTKAELASVLWRALDEPKTTIAFSFDDVLTNHWYYEPIMMLYNLGIIGTTGNTFSPNEPASYDEFLQWLNAAQIYASETGAYTPTTEGSLSVDEVQFIRWIYEVGDKHQLVMNFCPSETGWYEFSTSGVDAKVDIVETAHKTFITEWDSPVSPLGSNKVEVQLTKGISYDIELHARYFGEPVLALSLRRLSENKIASMTLDETSKTMVEGETWTPTISYQNADNFDIRDFDVGWQIDNTKVVKYVRGPSGSYDTISAVSPGTATISRTLYLYDPDGFSCGYITASCIITVSARRSEPKPNPDEGGCGGGGTPSPSPTPPNPPAPITPPAPEPEVPDVDEPIVLTFTDVASGAWYEDAIKYVVKYELMSGYNMDSFGPNDDLSRAQLAQMLYNKEKHPNVTVGSLFTDLANGAWYVDAVTWAANKGIVTGYGGGKFGPNDPITREQLAAMLYRYAGEPAIEKADSLSAFTDRSKVSSYTETAMQWAVKNGIVSGKGKGILDPLGRATRAEVAAVLMRYCENVEK